MKSIILASLLGSVAASKVLVPGGHMVNEECVHEVPSGTHIEETESEFQFTFPNGTMSAVPLCGKHLKVSHGGAWKTWAQYRKSGSTKITSLSNEWTVPKGSLRKGGQILYFWNGIEDGGESGQTGVLQPVLEWRLGSEWGIKSWYVGSGGTVTSNLVALSPGSVVTGSMSIQQDGTWVCTGQAAGGSPATLKFTRKQPTFTTAYEVLEAYSVGSACGMYPSDGVVGFSKTEVEFDGKVDTDVSWETYSCPSGPGCSGAIAACGEKTTVDSGDVNIHFKTSSSDVVSV